MTNTLQHSISRRHLTAASAALTLAVVLGLGVATQSAQAQTFKVLYNFTGGSDGGRPIGQPVIDDNGNIFGTATLGGSGNGDYGYGTVWEYSSDGTFSVLHSFDGTNAAGPSAGVKLEKGNLFGTTQYDGSYDYGTAFEITSSRTFILLYTFGSQNNDPDRPDGAVVLDTARNVYGTSYNGGSSQNCYSGCGTVWKLSGGGSETVLHSFDGSDGRFPALVHRNLIRFGTGRRL